MRLALLLIAVSSVWAVEPKVPDVRVEQTPNGPVVYVHNPMKQEFLTAVCLAVSEHPFWEDEIQEPIAPGAEKRIAITNLPSGVKADQVQVKAAIYSDGTLAGNPQLGIMIVKRRWFVMDTSHELIRRLQQAQHDNTPKATVMGDLKAWADSLQPVPDAPLFNERLVDRSAGRELILRTIAEIDKTNSYSDALVDLLHSEANIATSRPRLSELPL